MLLQLGSPLTGGSIWSLGANDCPPAPHPTGDNRGEPVANCFVQIIRGSLGVNPRDARLAQLEERRFAERDVVSSNPGRIINQGL